MIISILLVSLFSLITLAFDFSATGCIDEAGTSSCFADVLNEVAGTCSTVCGCDSPFNCANANQDCLAGCACVGYEKSINCILSSCWNKVYSCEYQSLLIESYSGCPISVPAGWPYVLTKLDQPGSCSCALTDVWLAQLSGGQFGLGCVSRAGLNENLVQECECCAVQEPVSAYYGLCNATSPNAVPGINLELALSKFAACEPSMAAIEPKCSDSQHGFPSVTAIVLVTTMQATGTGTPFNQAGTMTAAPYGSTTAWYFFGSSGPTLTATAVPYKGVDGNGSPSGTSSSSGSSSSGETGSSGGIGSSSSSNSQTTSKQGLGSMTQLSLESFMLTIAALILGLL